MGNRHLKGNYGYTLCFNLIASILIPLNIDPHDVRPDPFTELTDLHRRLGWGPVQGKETFDSQNRSVYTIILPSEAISDISRWTGDGQSGGGIQLSSNLSSGVALTLKEAKPQAAERALQILNGYGVDIEFAAQRALDKMMRDPEFKTLYSQVLTAAGRPRLFISRI